MIRSLFGTGSVTDRLRGGLEETSATQKIIADRVAGALQSSSPSDFADQLNGRMNEQAADLERNMAALADTELRYEATARLLHQAYSDLRTAAAGHA